MKPVAALLFLATTVYGQGALEKAKVLYDEKKYDQAATLLKSINEKNPTYAQAQYYLGRMAFDQQKLDDAEEYFEDAVEANPKVADYHYWLANTWGAMARDANVLKQGILAPKIKSEFEETVRLDPTNLDALQGLVGFYTEAPSFMGGSYEKALETTNAIAKIDAAEAHRSRADIYSRQEKLAEAEKEYLAAYKLRPQLLSQVVAFYVRTEQSEKGFKLAEEAYAKEPANMLTAYTIGRTSAITGQRLDRGEECLKKYLTYQPKENEPSHGGAHMRLGQIYEKRGSKPEARKEYDMALKIDPNLKDAKDGLARLK